MHNTFEDAFGARFMQCPLNQENAPIAAGSEATALLALLDKLPKSSIQHLYRQWVTCPRNEAKRDMVEMLWRHPAASKQAAGFWEDVRKEREFVERCKAAKAQGLPVPKF